VLGDAVIRAWLFHEVKTGYHSRHVVVICKMFFTW
jgi:hypothetical protein